MTNEDHAVEASLQDYINKSQKTTPALPAPVTNNARGNKSTQIEYEKFGKFGLNKKEIYSQNHAQIPVTF